MTKSKAFILGLAIATLAPFLGDYILFNDFTPCETVTVYEDGSSIQACTVKRGEG